jgi:hypothetical protein
MCDIESLFWAKSVTVRYVTLPELHRELPTPTINGRERTYRTICGRILRSRPVAQVNAVDDAGGEFDWLNNCMLAPRGNQGNGEGPSV